MQFISLSAFVYVGNFLEQKVNSKKERQRNKNEEDCETLCGQKGIK